MLHCMAGGAATPSGERVVKGWQVWGLLCGAVRDSLCHMCNQSSALHGVNDLCLQQIYLRVEEIKHVSAVNSSLLGIGPGKPQNTGHY